MDFILSFGKSEDAIDRDSYEIKIVTKKGRQV